MIIRTTKQIVFNQELYDGFEEWVCLSDLKNFILSKPILLDRNRKSYRKFTEKDFQNLCNSLEQKENKCTCPKPIEKYLPFPEDRIVCGRCGGAL